MKIFYVEITDAEQKKEQRIKRNEDGLRDFYYNIKYTNIPIIGVSEEERKGQRIYLKT